MPGIIPAIIAVIIAVAPHAVFGQNGGMTFLSITAAALLLLSSDLVLSDPSPGDDQSGEAVPVDDAPVDDVSGETDLSDPVAGDAMSGDRVSGDAGGIDASTGADAEASYSASAAPSRAAARAEEDPIAAAASGLVAQIEDDNNPGGDLRLVSMKTNGCTTTITASGISGTGDDVNGEVDAMAENASDDAASGRTWTIDWAVPGSLSPADTFIFIEVAPVKIAIVGDASKPDQAAKLSALFAAMFETQLDCTTQF
jgi:hypothetical protein